jgi:dTDP-4-dehydrorhamnose reductase
MLVTGGSGQLGTAMRPLLPEADFPSHTELDLADPDAVYDGLARRRPSSIVNCAAYTAVDAAETHEAEALCVNGDSVGELARYAADQDIPFVTFSTDYVFPGQGNRPYVESDPTDPINAYGRSKERGEVLALRYPTTLVVRTSWVISPTHPNFVATMLRLVRERRLAVVNDQWGCPTVTTDLAAAVISALNQGVTGLLHLTNAGETTWFELARASVELAGLDPNRITPCSTAEYPLPAPRPAYSVLGSERLPHLDVDPLPHWRDSLPAVVEGLLNS